MPRPLAPALLVALLSLTACGDDGSPPGMVPDAGPTTTDGGGPSDGGPTGCIEGQHMCGTGCIDDLPNEPTRGCRFGCGEACPQPEFAIATCTGAGVCAHECEPPATMGPDGTCACEPTTCETVGAVCGDIDDGCGGFLTCGSCPAGASCEMGACVCPEDRGEPNQTQADPFDLPPFRDGPDTEDTFTDFSISAADDEDWFRFVVTDSLDGGNPLVTVDLDMIPPGSDYDLAAWFICDTGTDATTCAAGAPDSTLGLGCSTESSGITPETVALDTDCEHFGTDDSGTVIVRVRPATWSGSCEPYRLHVRVE